MKVKGILINAKEGKVEVKEIEDKLEEYYDILKCDCIDIIHGSICEKWFTIVCDDEGLFKQNFLSAANKRYTNMLVGNLFICNDGDDSYLHSLSDEDIDVILEQITHYADVDDSVHPILNLD